MKESGEFSTSVPARAATRIWPLFVRVFAVTENDVDVATGASFTGVTVRKTVEGVDENVASET